MLAVTTLTTACVRDRAVVVPRADSTTPPAPSAADEERALLARVEVDDDPHLADYLGRIIDRLLAEDERRSDAPAFTVTLLRDPSLNAFAMPTGHIFVHTGLLARLDDETQVATILARELTHARRHDITGARVPSGGDAVAEIARTIGTATAIPTGREETTAVLSPVFRAILAPPLPVAWLAAVDGYGAARAYEADAGGVERLVRASYGLAAAARTFDHLQRGARAGGVLERFFYGREAALAERAEAMTRLAATTAAVTGPPGAPIATAEAFAALLVPVLRENATLDLRAGRFRLAQEQLDRALASAPDDARVHLLYGDLYRLRAQRMRSVADQDDLARKAFESYERCLALDPGMAEVQRQLGLLYYQLRQLDRAREAFARYVMLRPDAPDAARVREYLGDGGQ